MAELAMSPDCFTYCIIQCHNCGALTVPDDQEVVFRGKKFIPICLACYLVIGEKYAQPLLSR